MDNEKVIESEETPVEQVEAEAAENTAAAAEDKPQRTPFNKQNAVNRKRKKVCQFCAEKAKEIDFKDANKLRKFTSERGKILPRRVTGTCAMHQRQLTTAIKRARVVALLPYTTD